jgi:4-hydroxybenzoyl-CoA thioesterase
MLTGRRTLTVKWGECDPGAIVYFPRYFEWFDAATADLFESAGLRKADMLPRLRSRFLRPSTFGDRVVVASSITAWRRSSFELHHQVLRGDDLAVEAFVTRVWTMRGADGGLMSAPIPADVIALFAGETG